MQVNICCRWFRFKLNDIPKNYNQFESGWLQFQHNKAISRTDLLPSLPKSWQWLFCFTYFANIGKILKKLVTNGNRDCFLVSVDITHYQCPRTKFTKKKQQSFENELFSTPIVKIERNISMFISDICYKNSLAANQVWRTKFFDTN